MALFHKTFLKSVVALEKETQPGKYATQATGFLVGFLFSQRENPNDNLYRTFLVTNRHVFMDREDIWARFDKVDRSAPARFKLQLVESGTNKWLAHSDPKVDLAMISINTAFLNTNEIDYVFIKEENFAYHSDFENLGIELGDDLFVLGFPMGISGELLNYAIVRGGNIARHDNEIVSREKSFLIDSTVFPGNSGGPVILKPQLMSIEGTQAVNNSYLLGVISGYKIYQEILYSIQTNPPSIAGVSTENSSLCAVVPMDFAKQIYNEFLRNEDLLSRAVRGTESNTPQESQ